MSWLLFMDESGHDHRNMPCEVRGGIALQDAQLWPFVQSMQRLEFDSFGCQLHQFRAELKGSKLLDKDRFRWAIQADPMEPDARRKHTRAFLTKGLEKKPPTRDEFTAYGQACLEMARGVFQLLRAHDAVLFASVIGNKKGGNAFGATRKQLLGRTSVDYYRACCGLSQWFDSKSSKPRDTASSSGTCFRLI